MGFWDIMPAIGTGTDFIFCNHAVTINLMVNEPEILLSNFTILKASAGSGKTHALTKRYIQFLLSEEVVHNDLRNILAITFSNNAAKEMKERVLSWLKSVYFNDEEKIKELSKILDLERDEIIRRSKGLIDKILNNYSDFNVRTIDSFMATIFRSSAIDFGYPPDFEIQMSNESIVEYAFNIFLRGVKEGTNEYKLIEEIIDIIEAAKDSSSSYLWDPSGDIIDEIKELYRKLSSIGGEVRIADYSKEIKDIKQKIKETVEDIDIMISNSGLDRHNKSSFGSILELVRQDRYSDLIGKGIKNAPVIKPAGDKRKYALYNEIMRKWQELRGLVIAYKQYYAQTYYYPYLRFYDEFVHIVENVKKQQAKVFIEDINKKLFEYIKDDIVPDVYFRLGEVIFHYLIDEFQDTSPIQWKTLFPLIENSLSLGGTLFVVGDTKQAIYGFRDADYRIMKSLEKENPFSSAKYEVKSLETNYRSHGQIVEFAKKIFNRIAENDDYKDAVNMSGLGDYIQEARPENKDKGYIDITIFEKDDEVIYERQKIIDIIRGLIDRGYKYRDIAILTHENDDVVNITSWLNQEGIDVISYSSLDVRKRTITLEIMSLLKFLDSPVDDLSFASFILGDIFGKCIETDISRKRLSQSIDRQAILNFLFKSREKRPLYKAFQAEFGYLWELYFEGLFKSAGYLPLYDLAIEAFRIFHVFNINDEEGAFAKILEVIRDFEGEGKNSLSDFLDFAADGQKVKGEWDIDVPIGIDAVQAMTIHTSKGLEFPVVILVLYGINNKGFKYIVSREDGGATLFKITRDIASGSPFLYELYNQERTNEMVSRLNTLYVGITRAIAEMYIIGVKGKRDKYPFDIIRSEGPFSAELPSVIFPGRHEFANVCELLHHEMPLELPINTSELANMEEKKRGEFIHRILYFVDYIEDNMEEKLRNFIRMVNMEMEVLYPEDDMISIISKFLNNIQLKEYFIRKPERIIKKEQEFLNADGEVFRMDRVVIDKAKVAVIDFKTGTDLEHNHIEQMSNYKAILRQIYPDKEIEGILAYVDRNEVRRMPD